jgi:hypothetical protein
MSDRPVLLSSAMFVADYVECILKSQREREREYYLSYFSLIITLIDN